MRQFASLLLLVSFPQVHPAFAEPASRTNIPDAPDGILFERDIAYRKGNDRWLLNVIRPREESSQPRAVVVLVHGGGWSAGDHYRFSYMGFKFAQKGYVVVTPTYRMIKDAPFPACLHDVKNAIRWVRAHAEKYNIDPDRIGAYGNSAGGVNRDTPESKIRAVMRQASPSSYIRKDVPPMMLVHGAEDTVVFIDSTDEFVKKMKSVGADITYLRFEDAGHGVMGQKATKTNPAMYAFFEEHVRQKSRRQDKLQ